MADKLAVIQSEETIKELNNIDVKVNELIGTFNNLVVVTDKASKGLLTGLPKDHLQAVKEAEGAMKAYNATIQKVNQATSELERIQARIAKAKTEEGRAIASARVELAHLNKENKQAAQAALELGNAYDKLNAQHNAARNAARDAGVQHGIMSKQFLEAAAKANEYDKRLKQVDYSLGQFNRNVGNYHGNMFGLNAQMAQVMREMPNFAIDARIGIMSLTNNLPYLGDAIADVARKNKELKAEFKLAAESAKANAIETALKAGQDEKAAIAAGKHAEAQMMLNYQAQKGPSVFKQIIGSIFSWQTLLIVGITLLMQYSKEITNWIEKITKGVDVAEKLNKVRQEATKSAASEITQLEILYRVATNEALSREQRLRATDKLQKMYPSYFKNLSDEQIMIGNARKQY